MSEMELRERLQREREREATSRCRPPHALLAVVEEPSAYPRAVGGPAKIRDGDDLVGRGRWRRRPAATWHGSPSTSPSSERGEGGRNVGERRTMWAPQSVGPCIFWCVNDMWVPHIYF